MKNKTCIIIPAYNEEERLPSVLAKIDKKYTVIVINDGSTDGTGKIKHGDNVHILTQMLNLGKGASIATGCTIAFGLMHADNVIFMDADGQHEPEDLPKFITSLTNNDFVIGMRAKDKSMPARLRFGNWLISNVQAWLFGIYLPDSTCGFRALSSSAYDRFKKDVNISQGYNLEVEMNAWIAMNKIKYDIVILPTIYLDGYKGTDVFDGVKMIMKLIMLRIKYWW